MDTAHVDVNTSNSDWIAHAALAGQPDKPVSGWLPEHRSELFNRHPLKRRRYMIPTPMVQHAYLAIRECVYARRTGLVFIGKTRYGKTTCAKAVKHYLLRAQFKMPVRYA